MIANALRPTEDQLIDAVAKAKELDRISSSQIKMTDYGAGMVRHYLSLSDSRFSNWPLDEVRLATQNLSRAGKEPGKKQRDKTVKTEAVLTRLRNVLTSAYPRSEDHSVEYDELHASEAYKQHRDRLKRECGYRCQGCSLVFKGMDLQGHVVDYTRWDEPGMLLILCIQCHEVIDALRRRGASVATNEQLPELWTE